MKKGVDIILQELSGTEVTKFLGRRHYERIQAITGAMSHFTLKEPRGKFWVY